MVTYKLYYFNMKGRGELIRLLFAASGQKYEDFRIEKNDWPEYKAKSPFGQAPYLEITNGKKTMILSQSVAIGRYLARKFGFAGKGDEEQAMVDMYGDQISDLLNEFAKFMMEQDETKKQEIFQKLQNEIMPFHMKFFEAKLAQSKTGFFFDSGLTWIDLYLFNLLGLLGDQRNQLFEHFKAVKNLYDKVSEHGKIKAYLETRPETAM
ncbi:putative glutathione S-transferase 7 [Brachionus plicatilis]|uniref:Glutathione S-transferase S3 n=1 Tax=Brachionus plicatilis TaxID=10195 RepID=A0A3M7SBG8_BRAPC|nr:glutathione S-transferase S3 [Brachionus plicatilis]RNA33069.1 putative glutathione S-transferase 7 [Brachionus plicatilis]